MNQGSQSKESKQFAHCKSQQCFDSASLMCDHESFLATQYYLDQTKMFMSRFVPQNPRLASVGVGANDLLLFEKEAFGDTCLIKELIPKSDNQNKQLTLDNGFYLQPCTVPTYRNSLVCDADKCCSRSHQMFDNFTRQGTGRSGWARARALAVLIPRTLFLFVLWNAPNNRRLFEGSHVEDLRMTRCYLNVSNAHIE